MSTTVNITEGSPTLVTVSTNGTQGPQGIPGTEGANGTDGAAGATGPGVAIGGTVNQVLRKTSSTDYATEWHTLGDMSEQSSTAVAITGGTIIASSISETSDSRTKVNIKPLKGCLQAVLALKPKRFLNLSTQAEEIGLIAQDVSGIYPETVGFDKTLSLNYARLVTPLIGAIQEQQSQIRKLWLLLLIVIALLIASILPAHAITAPSIELSGTGVVISATKAGQTASITSVYGTNASFTTVNMGACIGAGCAPATTSWYSLTNIPTPTQQVSNSGAIILNSLGVTNAVTATTISTTYAYGNQASYTTISGPLSTAAQTNITSVGTLTGLTSTGSISASILYASTSLLVGPSSVSVSMPILNKQTGTTSLFGIGTEAPNGIEARMYADSTNVNFDRAGNANTRLSIGVTGVGIGIAASSANASLTVAGTISTSMGLNLSSPTSTPTCGASTNGMMIYNSSTKCLNYCDGTAYRQVTSLAAGCS